MKQVLSLMLKRIKSKSPTFYIKLRLYSGYAVVLCGFALAFAKINYFHWPANVIDQVGFWADHAGALITGVWGLTWTGTVDTTLIEEEEQK